MAKINVWIEYGGGQPAPVTVDGELPLRRLKTNLIGKLGLPATTRDGSAISYRFYDPKTEQTIEDEMITVSSLVADGGHLALIEIIAQPEIKPGKPAAIVPGQLPAEPPAEIPMVSKQPPKEDTTAPERTVSAGATGQVPANYCPQCGVQVKADARFCASCGHRLPAQTEAEAKSVDYTTSLVSHIQQSISEKQYGFKPAEPYVPSAQPPASGGVYGRGLVKSTRGSMVNSPKSRALAAVLAIFLGWLGIHRFYVGKPGSAVILLILTIVRYILSPFGAEWGIVFFVVVIIWVLVDFVLIVAGRFKDGRGLLIK